MKKRNACWALELAPIPGLVLDEGTCDYWIDKESFLGGLDVFRLNAVQQSRLLREMMAEKNLLDMKKTLHKLKGNVKLYGAKRLFESVEKFELVLTMDDSRAISKAKTEFDDAVLELAAQ